SIFFAARILFVRAVAPIRRRITVEKQILNTGRIFLEGGLQIEMIGVGGKLEGALEDGGAGAGTEAAVEEGTSPVRDDSCGIEVVLGAKAITGGTCAIGRIEAERTRLELRDRNAAIRAS